MNAPQISRDPHLSYVDLTLPETDCECTVGFEYTPAERAGTHSPGSPADVEVAEVWVGGADIAPVLLDRVCMALGDLVFEHIEAEREIAA